MRVLNNYNCEGQMSLFDPDTWCGRMFQEHSVQIKEQTFKPSLRKPQKWQKGMPAFLDLRSGGGVGLQVEQSWEMGGALLGEYMMRSFGECPSAENVSLLSQILEDRPHPKYSLSARACQGILNRANKRGKKLPKQLEEALIRQAIPLKSEVVQTELSGTLGVSQDQTLIQNVVCVENHPADSRVQIKDDGIVQILSERMGTGGGNVPLLMEEPYNATTGSFMRAGNSGIAETLAARDYKDPQIVCNSVVRRLTPLEYERLQGFPNHWTDIGEWVDSKGKKHKDADSPRYKALGNSIALPFWQWMADKMVRYIDNPTMASLFDGIGGFPLVYSRCGCKPVWASEIEEFPIAVTKKHFPDM